MADTGNLRLVRVAPDPATTPAVKTPEQIEQSVGEFLAEAMTNLDPLRDRIEERRPAMLELTRKLGTRYANASILNYEVYDPAQRSVIERLREFSIDMPNRIRDGSGLLILGRPGTGKDHLLAAMLKLALSMHGLRVSWWDGLSLFEASREAIKTDDEQKFIRRLVAPHVLALSDPQPPRGDLTDFQLRLLRDAVDRRYRDCKSTWLTTNVDSQQMAVDVFTAPVLDRLREGALQIACDWPSYRERRNAKP